MTPLKIKIKAEKGKEKEIKIINRDLMMNGGNKMKMTSVDGCLILKGPGEMDYEYGYEYVGDSANFFMCPQTEKSTIGLYEAICRNSTQWKPIFVYKLTNLVRVGSLLNQLADTCGMALVKTSFDSQSQYK